MIQTIHTNTYTTEASELLHDALGLLKYDGNCTLKEADDGENILTYNCKEFSSWQHDDELAKVLEVIDDPVLYALIDGQQLDSFEEADIAKLVGRPKNPFQIALSREKKKELEEINDDFYTKMMSADLGKFDELMREHSKKLSELAKKFKALEKRSAF